MKVITISTMAGMLFTANALAAGSSNSAPALSYGTTAAQGSRATATVHFNGEIVASTCVVKSATPQDKTVTLPQVTNQLFSGDGSTTGDTQFNLEFTGCTGATTTGAYVVVFTGNNPAAHDDLLTVTRGGTQASDVGIEVDYSGQALHFSPGNNEVALTPDQTGNAQIDLVAKYRQMGAVLPAAGRVTADMNYTVIYK